MNNTSDSASSPTQDQQILLVGDIRKGFLDADAVGQYPCEVKANILDAIDSAARGGFGTIAVVMNGTSAHLLAALRALRKSTSARIVLLAQMYEEPIARRLAGIDAGDEKLADAYLICPTRLGRLCGDEIGPEKRTATSRAPDLLGPDVERRLRHLERLATTDDLTGLKNRRYILEFARQVLEKC